MCVREQRARLRSRPPLHSVPAKRGVRLRREAHVAHHGDAGVGERPHVRRDALAALNLDRIDASLLDQTYACLKNQGGVVSMTTRRPDGFGKER